MKTGFLSRSGATVPKKEDMAEVFEKTRATPEQLKERFKDMMPQAIRVKAMTQTPGWKEDVLPFLEKMGNPRKLFGIKPEDYIKTEAEVRVFDQILCFIKNLSNIADLPGED